MGRPDVQDVRGWHQIYVGKAQGMVELKVRDIRLCSHDIHLTLDQAQVLHEKIGEILDELRAELEAAPTRD